MDNGEEEGDRRIYLPISERMCSKWCVVLLFSTIVQEDGGENGIMVGRKVGRW